MKKLILVLVAFFFYAICASAALYKIKDSIQFTASDSGGQASSGNDNHYDDNDPSINFIIGGNFDFVDGLKLPHLGGELYINCKDIDKSKWGFYTGMYNIKFFSSDTSGNRIFTRTQLVVPNPDPTNKTYTFIRGTYSSSYKTTYDQWGYYLNPTYRILTSKDEDFKMYLELHAEVVRMNVAVQRSETTHYVDTFVTSRTDTLLPHGTTRDIQLNNINGSFTNGFFGLGVPIQYNVETKFNLFIEPVLGVGNYNTLTYSYNDLANNYFRQLADRWGYFYLIRFRCIEHVTSPDLAVGGEIRGFFPG